jgi:hypothetical protein
MEIPMKCDVCGQDSGVGHDCPGAFAASASQDESAPISAGFAPLYYLRLAFNIARLDSVSIRRASLDSRAGIYGSVLWAIVAMAIGLVTVLPDLYRTFHGVPVPRRVLILALSAGLISGFGAMGLYTLIQIGLSHFIAKWFCGATGNLIGVMRPLLLGSFVNALEMIPVVGDWASGIAWTLVLILVLEKVDRIGRLQAFVICVAINVASHRLLRM